MNNVHNTTEDPYEVLGVNPDASQSEIRAAYRRLALQHHPDKQHSAQDKERANSIFASISHAYEIIGDEQNRGEHDRRQNAPFYAPMHEFHDPFQVFAHVFGQEFGRSSSPYYETSRQSAFSDNDPFLNDPFFSNSMFGGGSLFGGGSMFGDSMFGSMQRQMDMMRESHQDMMRRGAGNTNTGQHSSFYSSSSSSSSYGPAHGGNRESISTTTRIVNGKRQTITERVVTKPDGTVERHVDMTGDDDFPEPHRIEDEPQERARLPASSARTERTTPSSPKGKRHNLLGRWNTKLHRKDNHGDDNNNM